MDLMITLQTRHNHGLEPTRTNWSGPTRPNNILLLLLPQMHFHIKIQEEQENNGVEDRVQDPRADPVTPALHEVQRQHADVAGHVAAEQRDLARDDEGEARAAEAEGGPEAVAVDGCVGERGGEYGEHLERLGELEPEERHEGEDRVVEELAKRQPAAPYDGEERAEHVEEAGEVVEVGPEEDPTRGAGPEREAEEPLERGP
ncbi:hypothetical protein PanWU01x14_320400, partial [Parasponia andersonii]